MNTTTATTATAITPMKLSDLTRAQQDLLLETVGLDKSGGAYRNAWIAAQGSDADEQDRILMGLGLLIRAAYPLRPEPHWLYQCNAAGLGVARLIAQRRRSADQLPHCEATPAGSGSGFDDAELAASWGAAA
jgi:hypothetical protein